jgi:acylphosphatase
MHRVRLTIQGHVQGVGFRWFASREAEALGVTGWVANRRDGAVEVEAEGEVAALGTLVTRLRQGPGRARVDAVETRWSEGPARYREFEIRTSP